MFQILLYNLNWMIYNVLLALIPVFLGWLTLYARKTYLRICFFLAWLLFIPNTLYIFTDILHYIKDIHKAGITVGILLTLQYLLLLFAGFLTYILSMYPVDKFFRNISTGKKKQKKHKKNLNVTAIIITINFLIGIGMVLGRVHRLNSWDIVTEIEKVIITSFDFLSSLQLVVLAILFGLFANFIYFLFKKQTIKYLFKKNS